jgi:hypothetical protein
VKAFLFGNMTFEDSVGEIAKIKIATGLGEDC